MVKVGTNDLPRIIVLKELIADDEFFHKAHDGIGLESRDGPVNQRLFYV
jgi:hypothetical protein